MKGGLCLIYTISVLSSCALFILVVSEALHVQGEAEPAADASGLHNVSKKRPSFDDDNSPDKLPSDHGPIKTADVEKPPENNEMIFADSLSLNSVTTDGLPDTGQPPILITLADNAKLELKQSDELLFTNESEQHNDTQTFAVEDSGQLEVEKTFKEHQTEPTLIVKAKSMHETIKTDDAFQTTPPPTTAAEVDIVESQQESEQAIEPTENIPTKPETPQEDIPSFSEWAQKQLAEAEKKDTVLNHSTQPSHSNTNFSSKNNKIRSKNYASPACGAKIVAVNSEAGSASSILSPNRDEYMLNTCNSRIWFVVELCEAVQAQKIEIANFELFSSTPKEIAVYFSDRFPTRDWASVGQFTAKDMRDVQSFDLFPHLFGKFIKVEMLSHHGSEHYCPISLFKLYGTSEFEVLEKESAQHIAQMDDDDEDDEIIDVPDIPTPESETSKNLFGSARDAVMSIMKKAAQVLVKTEVPRNVSSEHNDTSTDNVSKQCCSPSHIIVCDNCSETLYSEVYELISCSSDRLTNLIRQVFLKETLKCTGICQPYGLDFKSTKTIEFSDERIAYVNALFPPKYLAALCNILAIKEKKVVLNTSFETELNVTINISVEEPPQKVSSEPNPELDVKLILPKDETEQDDNKTDASDYENTTLLPEQFTESNTILDDIVSKDEAPDDGRESTYPIPDEKLSTEQADAENIKALPENDNKPVDTQKTETENKDSQSKTDPKNVKIDNTLEKSKEGAVEETTESIFIDSDSFITDFDQLTVDPTPPGVPASQSNQNQGQTLQKESVFLRLSNRVKTLERNMSLSGQYLEELSRRYKKQVEEMQKTFEKTVVQMTEERRKSNEREQKYLEQMARLQEQLLEVASTMKILMDDRDSWFGNVTFFKFIILQTIIVAVILFYTTKRRQVEPVILPVPKKTKKKDKEKLRRKSVEGVSGHATPAVKKRRPSEEALQIARQSSEDIIEDADGEWQIARKNRRRKQSVIYRNIGCDTNHQWGRQDSIGALQENPIPLDEQEFAAPVSEPTQFDSLPSNMPKKEQPQTNGSIFHNLKSKTMKSRRLSSPAFLRTFSRQSTRSTPSPVVRSLEPLFNGKEEKKACSESPTSSLWSQSTEISQMNGFEDESSQKKKKGFKSLFKKVF